jgi:excisionase family DNA binding protein
MATQTADQLLTTKDLSARLRLGRTSVLALIRDGKLPARRIGRAVRVAESDLSEFIESLR